MNCCDLELKTRTKVTLAHNSLTEVILLVTCRRRRSSYLHPVLESSDRQRDRRWVGRALPEINFRGQRCSKPGGAWATSTCVTGPRSHLKGLGPCLGCTRRVCVLGVAHRAAWVSGAAAAAESERGEQVSERSPSGAWVLGSGPRGAGGERPTRRRSAAEFPPPAARLLRPRPGGRSDRESGGVTNLPQERSQLPGLGVPTRSCARR
ncbi:uncharacterized protein LOC104675356 [Rhinopithecus roxellana]|uniref:uncharacterized protein LOC104675356 n=1 Tax=Rhinopithecus roxellana TaxID=61622 RepID=UPI0005330330|nr:uncharacterized protein LOC104675356 [Rhinopithecus roxellana]